MPIDSENSWSGSRTYAARDGASPKPRKWRKAAVSSPDYEGPKPHSGNRYPKTAPIRTNWARVEAGVAAATTAGWRPLFFTIEPAAVCGEAADLRNLFKDNLAAEARAAAGLRRVLLSAIRSRADRLGYPWAGWCGLEFGKVAGVHIHMGALLPNGVPAERAFSAFVGDVVARHYGRAPDALPARVIWFGGKGRPRTSDFHRRWTRSCPTPAAAVGVFRYSRKTCVAAGKTRDGVRGAGRNAAVETGRFRAFGWTQFVPADCDIAARPAHVKHRSTHHDEEHGWIFSQLNQPPNLGYRTQISRQAD